MSPEEQQFIYDKYGNRTPLIVEAHCAIIDAIEGLTAEDAIETIIGMSFSCIHYYLSEKYANPESIKTFTKTIEDFSKKNLGTMLKILKEKEKESPPPLN